MRDLHIGSLCTGYGGLDMAVEAVTGATTAWVSDIDKGACKIIAHRYPDVPNIGDLTTVDWDTLEPIDILTAGYPCQPFSHAGQRKGTNDVRHLWPFIRQAVRYLRPRLTVLENVAGHRSLGFDRVLGDMAEDGLYVRWASLRAADVGACHGRERLFITVTDPRSETGFVGTGLCESDEAGSGRRQPARSGGPDGLTLLPTPAVNDMGAGKTVDAWDAWTDDMRAKHGNGNGHGASLAIEAQRLLPTPTAQDGANNAGPSQFDRNTLPLNAEVMLLPTPTAAAAEHSGRLVTKPHQQAALSAEVWNRWGDYAPAIARWESVIGRPAPSPTEATGKGGAHQLSPAFVEWMQGLSAGWVTDVPDLTRNEALKALGNGVVPQQAIAALRHMLATAERPNPKVEASA